MQETYISVPRPLADLLQCSRGHDLPLSPHSSGSLQCGVCAATLEMERGVVRCRGEDVQPRLWHRGGLQYDSEMRRAKVDDLRRNLYRPIVAASRGTILEIGCGTGRFLIEVAGQGWPVVGVDSNLDMISRAAERGLPFLVHAAAENLPFRSASFDTVVSVLAWVFVEERAYAEVARVLRPNGQFIYQLNNKFHSVTWAALRWVRSVLLGRRSQLDRLGPDRNERSLYRQFRGRRIERRRLSRAGLRLANIAAAPLPISGRPKLNGWYERVARRWPAISSDLLVTASPTE